VVRAEVLSWAVRGDGAGAEGRADDDFDAVRSAAFGAGAGAGFFSTTGAGAVAG
jgi:hypothetical protein